LMCAVLLLAVTSVSAAPITIGTFAIQNDDSELGFTGPTFVITNDSVFAGYAAIFSDLHLRFDLLDGPALDFALSDDVAPGAETSSNGLADEFGQSLLPDLAGVLDVYLTLKLLDSVTSALLPGTVSLAPSNPPLCLGCTSRMTDFTHGSTLVIQFDPEAPGTPVPEPASLFLLGGGVALAAIRKRWHSR
jgi:hypothetical protein